MRFIKPIISFVVILSFFLALTVVNTSCGGSGERVHSHHGMGHPAHKNKHVWGKSKK